MLEVDKKTFEDEVLKAEGYVFVDFFGDGCVPCQALMPFVPFSRSALRAFFTSITSVF